jgi:hypothetical protein
MSRLRTNAGTAAANTCTTAVTPPSHLPATTSLHSPRHGATLHNIYCRFLTMRAVALQWPLSHTHTPFQVLRVLAVVLTWVTALPVVTLCVARVFFSRSAADVRAAVRPLLTYHLNMRVRNQPLAAHSFCNFVVDVNCMRKEPRTGGKLAPIPSCCPQILDMLCLVVHCNCVCHTHVSVAVYKGHCLSHGLLELT